MIDYEVHGRCISLASRSALYPVAHRPHVGGQGMQPGHQREGAGVVAAFHRKLVLLDGVGDRFGEIGEEFFEPLGFGTVPRPNRYAFPLRLDRLGIVFDGVDYDLAACLFGSVFEIVLGLGRFTATLGLLKAANTPLMVKSDMDGRFASIASRFRARRMFRQTRPATATTARGLVAAWLRLEDRQPHKPAPRFASATC
jgi:hypothetical protein